MNAVPPTADDSPVFAEPWQARAFALVVTLCRDGYADWSEFQECLIAEIGAADAESDDATGYYAHWLAACERMLVARGLAVPGELARYKGKAAANRPPPTRAAANPVAVDPART